MTHTIASGHNLAHSRFTDLCDEPIRYLSPIRGFEQMPLVTLEKAMEPMAHFFQYIDDYVWTAKQNCKNPEDGLTQDESASICLYTMEFVPGPSFYYILNKLLRSEQRGELQPAFLYLKLFFTAMHKLPSHQCKLWRGIRDVDLSSQYTNEKEIVWWGVSSCTLTMNVLENDHFLGKEGVRTIFIIECQNGKRIGSHSYYKNNEEEVILMPGSYFRVKGILNPVADLHIIDMKEIQPPFPFVGPEISSASRLKVPGIVKHLMRRLLTNTPLNMSLLFVGSQKESDDNSDLNESVQQIKPVVQIFKSNIQPSKHQTTRKYIWANLNINHTSSLKY